MGISRDKQHKHRPTGGRCYPKLHKKRKYELGRPSALTKLGPKRLRPIRCRGGNMKYRALRLDKGNFSWAGQNCTCKARIVDVIYNASNNELVRTQTLVKSAIIMIDATPFRAWFKKNYGVELGKKRDHETKAEEEQTSNRAAEKMAAAQAKMPAIDPKIKDQFNSGKLMACISSRPGQSGRCDGYILEGEELNFYMKKTEKKKK